MPLSEYEQRVLEQMERQLTSDDPKLVNTFQGRGSGSVRRWLLTGAGALVGLSLLVVGAAVGRPWVGVLGFVTMFVAVLLAFSTPRRRGPVGVVGADGGVRRKAAPRPTPKKGFLSRLEARWERRRDQNG
ncbi:MAG: DUF3040 domain-containing protein [Cellulomonadaceae bacterium]|nr:DUF3040 domain-containing protein [Cellulomonadaceae bacterium]